MFSTISSPHLPGTYYTAGQKTINILNSWKVTRVSSGWIPLRCQGNDDVFLGQRHTKSWKSSALYPDPPDPPEAAHVFFSQEEEWKGRKIHWFMNAGEKKHHQQPSKIMGFFQGDDFGSPWKLEFWASFFVWKPEPSQAKTGFTCLCFHHDFL